MTSNVGGIQAIVEHLVEAQEREKLPLVLEETDRSGASRRVYLKLGTAEDSDATITIGNLADTDLQATLGKNHVVVAAFEESATHEVRRGKFHENLIVRFVVKWTYGQGAVNLARQLQSWLSLERRFERGRVVGIVLSTERSPGIVASREDGVSFADTALRFHVAMQR